MRSTPRRPPPTARATSHSSRSCRDSRAPTSTPPAPIGQADPRSATADAPATGTALSLVDTNHSYGTTGTPGPGPNARIGAPYDLAVAADETIYFAVPNNHVVYRLSPAGNLSVVAGTIGSYGFSGDGHVATSAQLNSPQGVALDEANQLLYIADTGNNRVRRVDLSTPSGLIETVAGGATASSPGYGDGSLATNAQLTQPNHVALGPDGLVYITDQGISRIRRYDPVSTVITGWIGANSNCVGGSATIYSCYYGGSAACQVTWDHAGNAYVSAELVGTDISAGGCNAAQGVVRVNADLADPCRRLLLGSHRRRTAGCAPPVHIHAHDGVRRRWKSLPRGLRDARRRSRGRGHRLRHDGDGESIHREWRRLWSRVRSAIERALGNRFRLAAEPLRSDSQNYSLRMIANAGTTTAGSGSLSLPTGSGQSAVVDGSPASPLTVTLKDESGSPLVGYLVTWTSTSEGGLVYAATSATDSNGVSSMQVRVGRSSPGPYTFTASYNDLKGTPVVGSPQTFTVFASAPTAGNIYTIVNNSYGSASTGVPGAGILAQIGEPVDIAVASNGDIYFADYSYHVVRKLSARGLLTNVAGTSGTSGYTGDGSAANKATLYGPWGVALDEAHQLLYISDYGNNVVRRVDLAAPTQPISTFAGNVMTPAPAPAYGDGGPATSATLSSPTHVAIGPDGLIYITDSSHQRIRTVDSHGTINAWLSAANTCAPNGAMNLWNCTGAGSHACKVAWDAGGNAYVSGLLGGNAVSNGGCTYTPGIMRQNKSDGSFSLVAGHDQGVLTPGRPATQEYFYEAPTFALDSANNVYLANRTYHTIQRIDAASGRLETIAGSGSAGFAGDQVPAIGAIVSNPEAIVVDSNQNILISDSGNHAIRVIAGNGTPIATSAVLTKASGDAQTVYIDQLAPASLMVQLLDAQGTPLTGSTITWTAVDPGGGLYGTTSTVDANGFAAIQSRAGLAAGQYHFTARFTNVQGNDIPTSPVTFTLNATTTNPALASGTIFTVVNSDHSRANSGNPGLGTIARVGNTYEVTSDAAGNIFFADYYNCLVNELTPAGVLSVVAGTGTCGNGVSGLLGNATQIGNPWGVAVGGTAPNEVLYIADYEYSLVRAVNLSTGIINTFAGGASAPSPGYGDSGPATNATLSNPTHLAIGPDGWLYISDNGHQEIRSVATSGPATGNINTWFNSKQGLYYAAVPITMVQCDGYGYGSSGCGVAWDNSGNAYVTGALGGTSIGGGSNGNTTPGIVQVAVDGSGKVILDGMGLATLTHIAGYYQGSSAEGASAASTVFKSHPIMAFDSSGNLFLTDYQANKVRRISGGNITTVAGNGATGYSGDYSAASGAVLSAPWGITALPGGHIVFADSSNYCVREIW